MLQPPPGPPSGVDGRYRGTARLVTSNDRFCPRSGPRTYQVVNGQVTLAYTSHGRSRVPLTAPIGPDGVFNVSDGVGTLEGVARDGRLEATITSAACTHRWTMTKIP